MVAGNELSASKGQRDVAIMLFMIFSKAYGIHHG